QPDPFGFVNLAGAFTTATGASVYAATYVYSPAERTVLMRVNGAERLRLWANGNLVHETANWNGWNWAAEPVPVTLRPGRNTILVKVLKGEGGHHFTLRLDDDPASRGIALAEMGLWKEAAGAWKPLFAENLPNDHWLWYQYAAFLRLSGDDA